MRRRDQRRLARPGQGGDDRLDQVRLEIVGPGLDRDHLVDALDRQIADKGVRVGGDDGDREPVAVSLDAVHRGDRFERSRAKHAAALPGNDENLGHFSNTPQFFDDFGQPRRLLGRRSFDDFGLALLGRVHPAHARGRGDILV